ncbi:uncharacterized protein F4822DRAFT_429223 [Hypoxylon trugodes]|uniref:uncharacterized protein n=1 Tax=Hypoxylon trugodes TaxID=326681 RepID=UPI00219356A3|nr:uncharacterized protein F4822DRAFT_429223 [Hypoxylon trugodes]KAI1388606.1 hypothetical protein F4822DRAFT_429223 [Hypoxylon trugodes]
MAASLFLLVDAGPVREFQLETRQYESYCCIPGCLGCSSNSCLNGGCSGVYGSCCAEGRREVLDGKVKIFNTDGEEMQFFD